MVYPTSAPPLKAGVNYLLQIQADNGRTSRDESAPGLSFKLLTPEETEPIRASEARLRALKLPSEAETFALVHLYVGQDLIAEAIELLEKLVKDGSQETAVYRTLGDLYHRIGLERLAEDRYLKAQQLAEKAGDVEGQAACLTGLGEVYISLGNRDLALHHWQRALQQYKIIGDAAKIAQVQQRIDETK